MISSSSLPLSSIAGSLPKSRLSRRVALLEERLGVRLLDRTTRGICLTEVGQQVFEHSRAAVMEAEAAEEAAARMQSEPRGLVRMSSPLGLQSAIAAALPVFLAAHRDYGCNGLYHRTAVIESA